MPGAPQGVASASVRALARVGALVLVLALAPRAHAAVPVAPTGVLRAQLPQAQAEVEPATSCACQDDRARNRKLGGAASAAMALAGLILAVRRFRQRNRLPREDRKFGSYRGPKP